MLITCPECGRQVSDKAPFCPHCGIEIAGTSAVAAKKTENLEHSEHPDSSEDSEPVVIAQPLYEAPAQQSQQPQQSQHSRKKGGHGVFFLSFLIAATLCAAFLYFYKTATDRKAAEEQQNIALIDSLNNSKASENSDDAESTGSSESSESYEYSESSENTDESEVSNDSEGSENSETTENAAPSEDSASATISPEECQRSLRTLRKFFQAINAKNREAAAAAITPVLTSFNGKAAATKTDVNQYITDLYQADVRNLNWHLGEITHIKKTELGEGRYEYELHLSAVKETQRADSTTSHHQFAVSATISPDGKVSAVDIVKK